MMALDPINVNVKEKTSQELKKIVLSGRALNVFVIVIVFVFVYVFSLFFVVQVMFSHYPHQFCEVSAGLEGRNALNLTQSVCQKVTKVGLQLNLIGQLKSYFEASTITGENTIFIYLYCFRKSHVS